MKAGHPLPIQDSPLRLFATDAPRQLRPVPIAVSDKKLIASKLKARSWTSVSRANLVLADVLADVRRARASPSAKRPRSMNRPEILKQQIGENDGISTRLTETVRPALRMAIVALRPLAADRPLPDDEDPCR